MSSKPTKPYKPPSRAQAWKWEILSLIGALALFATLVVLLFCFDRQPVFQWYGVTLNTIVAIVSTAFKALLFYSIAECIGQWKWILFQQDRELMDFERLDQATRGPVGSFWLLWRTNVPWLLRLGVFLVVLGIAVDPFSQQLIQLEPSTKWVRSFKGFEATSPLVQSLDEGSIYEAGNIYPNKSDPRLYEAETSLPMQAAILSGLSQDIDRSHRLQLSFQCPTSNCTWKPFETLGICHKCNLLTSELRKVDNFTEVFEYLRTTSFAKNRLDGNEELSIETPDPLSATALSLPNGHFLLNMDGCNPEVNGSSSCYLELNNQGKSVAENALTAMTSFGTGNPTETNSMRQLDTMIWSTSVIHTFKDSGHTSNPEATDALWPDSPVQAMECSLYYCVKNISCSVEDNVLLETTTEVPDFVRKPDSWKIDKRLPEEQLPSNPDSLSFDKDYGALNRTPLSLHDPNRPERPTYNISESTVLSISSFFQKTFREAPWKGQDRAFELVKDRIPNASVFMNGVVQEPVAKPKIISAFYGGTNNDIDSQFEMLATSMTNYIRESGQQMETTLQLGASTTYNPTQPQIGWVGISITVYASEWYWIILHGLLLGLSALFCYMTAFHTKGKPHDAVWKNHSLAAIRQGAISDHRLEDARTVRELEELARRRRSVFLPVTATTLSKGGSADTSTGDEELVEARRMEGAPDIQEEVPDLSDAEEGGALRQAEEGRRSENNIPTEDVRRPQQPE